MMNKSDIRNDRNIGIINVTRGYGSSSNRFVGSTVPSDTTITISIRNAEKFSDKFSKETFYGKENIVEVEMTPNQWAELITTINYGSGTPCTVTMIGNERIPQTYETESVFEYHNSKLQSDFEQKTTEFKTLFAEALDILDNKKTITKSDRDTIARAYRNVERFFGDSAPFMQKLFKEDLERHTVDAAIAFKHDMDAVIKSLAKAQLENIKTIESITAEKVGSLLLSKPDDKNQP